MKSMAIVPAEPTDEMLKMAVDAIQFSGEDCRADAMAAYSEMLEAAPKSRCIAITRKTAEEIVQNILSVVPYLDEVNASKLSKHVPILTAELNTQKIDNRRML